MTVEAHVVEVRERGETADHGAFAFAAAPAAGDQVVIGTAAGSLHVFRVSFVEHDPVALRPGEAARQPRLTVFVTLVGDVD